MHLDTLCRIVFNVSEKFALPVLIWSIRDTCSCSLSQKFKIEVDVYVSKKKKLADLPFLKPLISYPFFDELVDFVRNYWQKRKFFYPGYQFTYPRINQSLKWRFDYVVIVKNNPGIRKKWTVYLIGFMKNERLIPK